ncbi:hypothetical protein [Acrocarpospora sp. B8E8]|uniref:DUF222 domain-containing protein n=1 Tax=Acrocarpospora sp. B8E8 TaxID=3153572 RepID=UPI00325D6549
MLGSPIDVRDPSRAKGARGRELPAFLKGTVLDPDYVPPQRPADDTFDDAHSDPYGDAGQQNTPQQNKRQQFLYGHSTDSGPSPDPGRSTDPGRSANAGRSPDSGRSTDAGRFTDPGRSPDPGRSADAGRSMGPEAWGEPVGSGVLVAQFRQLASRIAMADLPEDAGLWVGETEDLLFAQDRLSSAIAARVGRVHATGEAKSAGSGGHASTGTWLRASAGMSSAGASRLIRLAMQLARLPLVRDRFASGTLAEGSVEAISQVTTHLTDAQAGLAEPILLDLADRATPAEILKAGQYLRELLDPGALDDDAETDYAARSLLVRPSSTGGVEGEFRLPREAGARLREFLTAYARPKGKDDDRPLRLRQADALSALLSKKVTTELLVLVRAESLPTDHPTTGDHPTHDHPTTTDHITDHPTHDADSTHAASSTSTMPAMPTTGAPPSQSTAGHADTAAADAVAADTADPATDTDADTTGSSDTRPGTPQAGDGSTCHAAGPRHTEGTTSAGAGADSTSTGSAGAGADSMDTGSAEAGAGSTSTGSAGAGSAGAGAGNVGAGEGPVGDVCRTCGHAPDRLAPGLLIATGQLLPISDVHRLARTSRLVRLVVDAQGQVLDMGRAVRLATPAQRRAVLARYTTCYREGCPIPADMAEIDHVKGWAEGGTTDLDLLAPACTWHNRDKATHPDHYRTRRNHDGTWTLLYHGKSRFAGRFRR